MSAARREIIVTVMGGDRKNALANRVFLGKYNVRDATSEMHKIYKLYFSRV